MEEYLKKAVLDIIKENLLRKEEFIGYLNQFIASQSEQIMSEIVKTLKTEDFIKHVGDRISKDLYSQTDYPSTKLSLLIKDEVGEYIVRKLVQEEVEKKLGLSEHLNK